MLIPQEHILTYDGTFDGFLTCVFQVYDLKMSDVKIQRKNDIQESLFGNSEDILTDLEKADRVWKGIKKKTSSTGSLLIYYAFLSEQEAIENLLLRYIKYALKSKTPIDTDFGNEDVLKVTQIAKSVGREKHRMEAFVRFKLTKDQVYFANIEPDFDVLPLISKHFKSRYADQKWIIYDIKRNYGLFYDLEKVDAFVAEMASVAWGLPLLIIFTFSIITGSFGLSPGFSVSNNRTKASSSGLSLLFGTLSTT